jgi:hypothetical protein
LNVIPVDPHRMFVHWWVAPETLERARRRLAARAGTAHLALRFLRLDGPDGGARGATDLEDFPLGAGWHEQFFSLREPGGVVVGALGVKDAAGRFTPLLTSLPVALPQPLAAADLPAARPAPETRPSVSTPAKTAPGPARGTPVLDERAILAAVSRLESLPPELRRVPGDPAGQETPPATGSEQRALPAGAPPDTPALDERRVLIQVFGSQLAASATEAVTPAPAPAGGPSATRPAGPAASSRLASQAEAARDGAPLQVCATLVINGRVRPGYRLRIGDQEIAVRPDGGFTCQHRVDFFPAAWSLLLHAAAQPGMGETPSLELLTRVPDGAALLTLDSCVEIEGELRDASYRAHLPRGVNVDAAGRFRLVRSLPPGALFLPHLVLVDGQTPDR